MTLRRRRSLYAWVTLVVYWTGFLAHIPVLGGLGVIMLVYGIAWDIDIWRRKRKVRNG